MGLFWKNLLIKAKNFDCSQNENFSPQIILLLLDLFWKCVQSTDLLPGYFILPSLKQVSSSKLTSLNKKLRVLLVQTVLELLSCFSGLLIPKDFDNLKRLVSQNLLLSVQNLHWLLLDSKIGSYLGLTSIYHCISVRQTLPKLGHMEYVMHSCQARW